MHEIVRLGPEEVPKHYYNIIPDLPKPLPPPLNPETKEPITPKELSPIFPRTLIKQEASKQSYIRIPEEVRETYMRLGRPSPLYRASRLEKALKTKSRIYFNREDVSFTGSHKVNTAIPQAYYNAEEGVEKLVTETGAGQWGSGLSMATRIFGLECQVFMVASSYRAHPTRKTLMNFYGGQCFSSPSKITETGKKLSSNKRFYNGSLGIAISEAMEVAAKEENTKYALGSVLNHVMIHQSVIGQELMHKLELLDEEPDIMVACVGGGSNFAGFVLPVLGKKLRGKGFKDTRFVAAEPTEVPSMTRGDYKYEFGDTAGLTPLLKMYTLGKDMIPPVILAEGLRYHGMSPIISLLKKEKEIEAVSMEQKKVFEAARLFARTEGLVPAPESSHAIAEAIEEARNKEKTIVINISGHGLLDLKGYGTMMRG